MKSLFRSLVLTLAFSGLSLYGASATFVAMDSVTQGNWQNSYGSSGYNVVGDMAAYPPYVTVTPLNARTWTWAGSTDSIRALSNPSGQGRIAATWYSSFPFIIDLAFNDGAVHQIAIYSLDWDAQSRAETVNILDGEGHVLNTQSISNFQNGVYLVWQVSGHVRVRVTPTGGSNGVVSGIFFDEVTAPAPPAPSPVSVSVNPPSGSLQASQSQQFTATVTGASDSSVNWSLNPAVGTISNTGLYTAPPAIPANQNVTVTATSVADPSQSSSASISLVAPTIVTVTVPTPPTTSSTATTLPIEVMGAAGTTASVSLSLASVPAGNQQLSLRVHGVRYDGEASVQVNNSGWLTVSNATVNVLGLAANYGGIGGGFKTLDLTVNLPAGTLTSGTNTVSFAFNGTDGRTSGFRVLDLNLLVNGNALLPSSTFAYDDPSLWTPPSTLASDISAGQSLWRTASLVSPVAGGGSTPILAHCMDCHSQDGRDLKYFNYSNNSIVVRSQFHGLTAAQGNQIASYIRSLPVTAPPNGRPWNPPYQPGPGLDSQPAANWSAGAGISAVLSSDAAMLPYLAPSGSTTGWAANQYLNPRELPIPLQLPDWNSWLPDIHPMDAFGGAFTASGMNTRYAQIRSLLVPNSPNSYAQWGFLLPTWQGDAFSAFLTSYEFPSAWTAASRDAVYSAALWMMVKNWEINQEYGLEGMPSAAFGSKANARAWDSGVPFNVSPIILHITPGPGLGNGSDIVREYLGYIWYHMQLVLNDGNGHGASQNPIDWNYTQLEVMGLTASSGAPHAMLEMTWLIKSLQEMTQLGIGPDRGGSGFQPTEMSPMILVYPSYENNWSAIPPATRVSLTQACLQAYFNQVQSYSNLQYDIGVGSIGLPWASPIENPQTDDWLTVFGGEIWHMLPRMRFLGVSPSLTYSISGWASTLWPAGNWGANNGSTCNNLYTCASD